MQVDDSLADLPEAMPLRRVSPLWRLFALLAGMAVMGLMMALFVLSIALWQRQVVRGSPQAGAPTPPPPGWAPPGMGAPTGDDPDAAALPYPTQEDLRATATAVADSELRQQFLRLGQEVWKCPRNRGPAHVIVSPDGLSLAYLTSDVVAAGPFENVADMPVPQSRFRGMGMPGSGPGGAPYPYMEGEQIPRFVGMPTWSGDNRYVFAARTTGAIRGYDVPMLSFAGSPLRGDFAAPFPKDTERFLVVRARAAPKLEAAGKPAALDPLRVVEVDTTGMERVLVPEGAARWPQLSVSPDGRRVALISNRGHEASQPPWWRVFVMDLAGGEPQPLTPPAVAAGPVCWTPDGRSLVYARSQELLPADARDSVANRPQRALDLFEWSFEAKQEKRLSRGGGFYSPTIADDERLFFLTNNMESGRPSLRLIAMPLAAARSFAAEHPELPTPDAAAWVALLDQVLDEVKVAPGSQGADLNADKLAQLADVFARRYEERFKAPAPRTAPQLDSMRAALAPLTFSAMDRARLRLVLGVVDGEQLRRVHDGRWHLTSGSLTQAEPTPATVGGASPFGYVFNPFRDLSREAGGEQAEATLEGMLRQAAGRPLLLANDPAAAQGPLAQLVDPELAHAEELLRAKKPEEAEAILVKMLAQERHRKNEELVLSSAALLVHYERWAAVRKLIDPLPRSAAKLNLLGISFLKDPQHPGEAGTTMAITTFKDALRCDLHDGAAYMNLALAYTEDNNPPAARLCLLRYLELMSDGPYAVDARRRLSILGR